MLRVKSYSLIIVRYLGDEIQNANSTQICDSCMLDEKCVKNVSWKKQKGRGLGRGGGSDVNGKKYIFLKSTILRNRMSTRFIWRGICSCVNEIMMFGLAAEGNHSLIS